MTLRAVCPECGTTETLAEDFTGDTIECRRCQNVFAVPQQAPATQAAPRPEEAGFDLVEDEEPTPPKKSAKNARRDDDDEYDDEPAPNVRREQPAMPPRKKPSPIPVVILGLLALVVGGGSAASTAYLITPELYDPSVVKNDPFRPNQNDPDLQGWGGSPPVPTAQDALSVYKPNRPDFPNYSTLKLPGKVTDACAGAEGRLLCYFVAELQQIVVVDLCEGKIRTTLSTPSKNIRLTATQDKLFVVDADKRSAERWDLRTLNKDLTVPKLPGNGEVVAIAAGCATQGPVLVSNDELDVSGRPFTFLDDRLQDAGYVWEGKVRDWEQFAGFPNVRCTADGVYWYCTDAAPPGDAKPADQEALYIERKGINTVEFRNRKLPAGVIAPAQIKNSLVSRLYTRHAVRSHSTFTDADTPLYGTPHGKALRIYPPVVGPFSLMLVSMAKDYVPFKGLSESPDGPRAFILNDDSEGFLQEAKPSSIRTPIPSPLTKGADPLPWDREVFYVPLAEMVAVVNGSRDRIELIAMPSETATRGLVDLNLPRDTFICGTPPNTFTPGQRYTHQAYATKRLPNALLFTTTMEVKGFKVTDRGLITWDPPADLKAPYVDLTISIGHASTSVVRQDVRLFNSSTVRKVPPPMPKPKDPMPKPKDPKDPKDPMPKPKDPKDPSPMPPVVPTEFAPGVQLVKPAAKVPALTPVAFEGASTTVNAPGAITDLCIGGGGRYILVHVPTQRKVSIFDVSTAKFVGFLKTEEENLFIAAGAEKALLVYPEKKRVERWNLTTFTKEADKVLDVKQTITAAAMGNATAGPLVLGGPKAQNNASKMALMFVDIDTFKEVKIENADGKFGVTFGAPANLRVSSNGKLISAWFKDAAPSGVQMAELTGNTLKGVYLPENAGQVIASADGTYVGTNIGMFHPNTARTQAPTDVILPAVQHGGYLVLTPPVANHYRKVTVVPQTGDPLGTYENLPSYDGKRDPFERETTPLALDQRIIFVPDAKALIVIPPAANKLHVIKVPPQK